MSLLSATAYSSVDAGIAADIECFEERAWIDMYDAIPGDFAEQFGLAQTQGISAAGH
jgi:hypothetical protein